MGNIFRVLESKSYHFICDELKYLSTSKLVFKEMGEPLIVDRGQEWIFAYDKDILIGFCAYIKNRILYFYTIPEYRRKGVFNLLYNHLPEREWQVVASNDSYPIFLKKGFEVIKNYVNCHRLIKKI